MMSSRAARMMEHHLRNRAAGDLNLIPMIDILCVLVSFLLIYSTEVEVVQNSKNIEIPESIVTNKPRETVVVMLTKDEVFVQGERVASIAEVQASPDPIIAPLRDALNFLHYPTPDVSIAALEDRSHPASQRLKAEELLAQQLSLRQLRAAIRRDPAIAVKAHGRLAGALLAGTGFTLTRAQERVLCEVRADHIVLLNPLGEGLFRTPLPPLSDAWLSEVRTTASTVTFGTLP